MSRLLIALLLLLPAGAAEAQLFYDDFEGSGEVDFAAASDDWDAVWPSDLWSSALNAGGISPMTDIDGPGAFGDPADAYDNALVTGEDDWHDYWIEVDFFVADDDALGLVVRYTSADSYYLVVLSRDVMPDASGGLDYLTSPETRLYRVTPSGVMQVLDPVPAEAHSPISSLRQRLRIDVVGQTLTAWIGSGDAPIDTADTPLFVFTDTNPSAPDAGKAGVYAFAMGDLVAGTYFDSFRVRPVDSDDDGRNNDEEIAAGTDPYDADSDDDGLLDGDELLWDDDTDGDTLINALDWDSDDDGLPDGLELGINIAHPDTDLAEGHFTSDGDPSTTTDPLDDDSDDGGVIDGEEDLNANGIYEAYLGETDPNDGDDDGDYPDGGADSDSDTDTDGDSDSDGDADGDGDTDVDTDTSGDGGLGGLYGGPNCSCAAVGNTPLLGGLVALFLALL